jgi:hypothetical protein
MNNAEYGKATIVQQLAAILQECERAKSQIATKEEVARQQENRTLVDRVVTYTPDAIVKGVADLQLDFSSTVVGLADRLTEEREKLDDIRLAIEIENAHLSNLTKIGIVADALDILTQRHQEDLQKLDRKLTNRQEDLQKERTEIERGWQREVGEYEELLARQLSELGKNRQRLEDEYDYHRDRTRQLAADDYAERQRQQEWDLQLKERDFQQKWQEREAFLTANVTELADYQKEIVDFPAILEEAVKKSREEGIKEVSDDGKVKANLAEKEWEGFKQDYEYQIQSHTEHIERQDRQIESLTTQLQAAIEQAKSLALKAFETSVKLSERS